MNFHAIKAIYRTEMARMMRTAISAHSLAETTIATTLPLRAADTFVRSDQDLVSTIGWLGRCLRNAIAVVPLFSSTIRAGEVEDWLAIECIVET